jgi:hypothetical protein
MKTSVLFAKLYRTEIWYKKQFCAQIQFEHNSFAVRFDSLNVAGLVLGGENIAPANRLRRRLA